MKLQKRRSGDQYSEHSSESTKVSFRAWKAFQTTGTAVRKVGGGLSRTTTAGDDQYIILQAKRGRQQSASAIAQQLSTTTGRQVSRFTVARRPHKKGIFARRPERCLRFEVRHRRHRLHWSREHKNWTTYQWNRVLFTDESRFSTRRDSQRILICREIGTRFYPTNKERHSYGDPGVLVWGGIMLNGLTVLHIFDRGTVTGNRYWEKVLLPHVRLFRGANGPNFIFMDDNGQPHRRLAVEQLLESEDITQMDWPAYSADLNPIEHVRYALGRRIAARLHHPKYIQQLKPMLIEEWALLPQEMLHQLVLSMRRRCEATIAAFEERSASIIDSGISGIFHKFTEELIATRTRKHDRQVAKMVAKNNVNLSLLPRFR
ncbi:transposable element Tc1 transposase [Trichonephila clavipes]|uniref:Transposable element Tc1 transposase n=1 Tax=Trichonephila clavipes TaxID=2585209 RepID=A0A8X6SI04_TRICX|nr:transposable element Tc1 transposase [Trichonephila clavipes]